MSSCLRSDPPPHRPSSAPFVYNLLLFLCAWFFVVFLPIALRLLSRGKGSLGKLCIAGACAGAVPAAALMFFFIGMGVHGNGILWLPAVAFWLGGVCAGAALGAAIAATFGIFARDRAA
jgi:hypothetical protein